MLSSFGQLMQDSEGQFMQKACASMVLLAYLIYFLVWFYAVKKNEGNLKSKEFDQ